MNPLHLLCRALRHRVLMPLWRWGVPLPARPGWKMLVRDVVEATTSGSVYVQRDAPGEPVGAPWQWSLVRYDTAAGKYIPIHRRCAVSGIPVNGGVVLVDGPDGTPQVDESHWGVRCARCGLPLHVRLANMRLSTDPPMCGPCRPFVRRAAR